MATVALDTWSDPRLWTPDEQADPAMYMHRLIVRRKHAGLGTEIMDWASHRAPTASASTGSASTYGPTTPAYTATTRTTASNTSERLTCLTTLLGHCSSGLLAEKARRRTWMSPAPGKVAEPPLQRFAN